MTTVVRDRLWAGAQQTYAIANRRTLRRALLIAYAAFGAAAIIAGYFIPAANVPAYLVASMLPVVALFVGPAIMGSRHPMPWYVLGLGQLGFLAGDLIWASDQLRGVSAFPAVSDVFYIAAYPLMALGLALFIRQSNAGWRSALLDATLIAIAGALVLWIVHADAFIHDTSIAMAGRLVMLTYPLGDTLLIAAIAYLVLGTRTWRSTSGALLLLSLASLLAAEILHVSLFAASNANTWSIADVLWNTSYVLIGLSALVPSMTRLTARTRNAVAGHQTLSTALALALIPTFAAAQQLLVGHVDLPVVIVAGVVVAGVLLLRVQTLLRSEVDGQRRYAALLERASDAFTVIDANGDVRLGSPASSNILGRGASEFTGQPLKEVLRLVHPEDVRSHRQRLRHVMRTPGASDTSEVRALHRDGTYRWLHVTATNRIDDPAVNGIVLNYHDVTDEREARDQLAFQATILANIHESVIATDTSGIVTHWNAGASAIFGYEADEMVGRPVSELYSDQQGPVAEDLADVLGGRDRFADWKGRHKDGIDVWADVRLAPIEDGAGQPLGFVGVARNVTEQRQARAEHQRLKTAIEQTSESVVVTDLDGTIEYVNAAFERATGYAAAEVVGENPRLLKSGQQAGSFYGAMWTTLTAGQSWIAEFINRRKDGGEYISSAVISPIRDESGTTTGYVGVARDVTVERQAEETALRLARERALIAETIRNVDSRGTPEEIGQGICRQVASLADVLAAALYVFEADGEATSSGIALTNGEPVPTARIPSKRTRYLLERAQHGPWIERWRSVPGHPFNGLFRRLRIKATAYAPVRDGDDVIGLLLISCALPDAEQLLAAALPALVEFADISATMIGAKVADRTRVADARRRLRRVIDEREFRILFQPIVDTEVNSVVGYEALTRFSDGVAPDVRFAEAAVLGMSVDLETSVIRQVLAESPDLPEDVWLNINVSPAVLREGSVLADVLGECERKLIVEITEHQAIDDYASIREAVHRLGPNVHLAIDDAGAGFASMRHIVELRPAFVKIDRAVVAGIDGDEARRGLVAGMRHFARTAGFWLIAEGVETEAELKTLRRLDVHFVQGFFTGRPAPTQWIGKTDTDRARSRAALGGAGHPPSALQSCRPR